MSDYNVKNYTEMGGEMTHIGGSLIIEEGAIVEGLPDSGGYELPIASDSVLGGVKVGEGLSVTEEGVLSADGGEEYVLPVAGSDTLGGVKPDSYYFICEEGVLSVESILFRPPGAKSKVLGIVKPGNGLKISEEGVLDFAGYENKCVRVSGNMEDDNIEVIMPSMVSRYHISEHFDRYKDDDVYVAYEDDEGNVLFRSVIRSVSDMGDHRTYFQAYRYIGNRTLREYIIGITFMESQSKDVLITRDISF